MNKISVSTLVFYLKKRLETDDNTRNVTVVGELSNFHLHNSGHLYFTLKDDKAAISCVMFSSKASNVKLKPKNGDKVIVTGYVSIFENSGQLQLYVNTLKLDGIGDLYQQYEELKNKLHDEGYFNEDHKKTIRTFYPSRVGVIVGDNSAAMSDIKKQFARRWPLCTVDYYPSLVQGNDAPKDLIKNLLLADKEDYDAIILARGGGSFEDLFCFNDENLVKTIYNLDTFIITGIGHEQDFTLADFVADLRAPTPTACVELITPNILDIEEQLDSIVNILNLKINKALNYKKRDLDILINNRYLLNPMLLVDKKKMKIDYYLSKLDNYANTVDKVKLKIDFNINKINEEINYKINNNKVKLENNINLLNAYSVNKTLNKGYSIIYKDKTIIKNINNLSNNDEIEILMSDGKQKFTLKGDN